MKRSFDLIVSLICSLCLMPFAILIATGIKIKLGSPILFRQQRPGLNGKPFYLYKFRTMSNERDKNGNLLPDDKRLNSFGLFLRRYSIDEIPQLLNVIRGKLSLVGPRPLLMDYLPLYTEEQRKRHQVRPGITGWAQVNGRNMISWEEKFALDVWYVENRSFFLDLKIIFLTVYKVLKSEGISQEGNVTMEPFKGLQSKASGGSE
ncbi:sugar transferase [Bacillus suaedae]|uniref:Sugar transferase n=1 Tax=Halalkalibacter suaedae TaxID=2822140 RepID=A0A941ANE1_9BACI|nr:sugar transferase [Bacillus suaedae]MBP3951520.1 sugar transferase [Bacillus suaedae]